MRRNTAETEWAASLGKRRGPAFGGKVECIGGKTKRSFFARSRTQIVSELDGATVTHGPGFREAKNGVARIGDRSCQRKVATVPQNCEFGGTKAAAGKTDVEGIQFADAGIF